MVGFVDLLGQREALRKTDFVPDRSDPEAVDALIAALKDSVGVIRALYKHFDTFLAHEDVVLSGTPAVKNLVARVSKNEIKRVNYADGIMTYTQLNSSDDH